MKRCAEEHQHDVKELSEPLSGTLMETAWMDEWMDGQTRRQLSQQNYSEASQKSIVERMCHHLSGGLEREREEGEWERERGERETTAGAPAERQQGESEGSMSEEGGS